MGAGASNTEGIEERIRDQLLRVVGLGAAQFFDDARAIATGKAQLATSLHLLAHCLREIESSVRELAAPSAFDPASSKNKTKGQIAEATRLLQLDDDTRDIWLELAGATKRSHSKLHALAHRQGFAHARRDVERLKNTWDKALRWLEKVLPRLETRFVVHLDALDDILSSTEPQIGRLVNEVPNSPVLLGELFRRLNDPRWLVPLRKKGYFDRPPDTVRHSDDSFSFPRWPQLMYLEKVAASEPEIVAQILQSVASDNQIVHSDMAKVACRLPPERLANWAAQEARWIEEQEELYGLLCEDLGACVQKLAELRQDSTEAMMVARALLQPKQAGSGMHGVRLKYDSWHLAPLLGSLLPPMAKAWPDATYALVADLLLTSLDAGRRDGSAPSDYSYIWKPNLVSDGGHDGVLEQLVVAFYRLCVQLIDQGYDFSTLIQRLVGQEWHIFRRVALALAADNPEGSAEWAEESLLGPDYFDEDHFRHEYVQLLQAYWPRMSETKRARWLDRVDKGIDTSNLRRWVTEDTGAAPSAENIEGHSNRWRLKQLWPLKKVLPDERRSSIEKWEAELGEPEDAFFAHRIRLSVGPVSPITTDELNGMSAKDIAAFCKSWTYEPGPDMPPSPLGLAREFASITENRLDEFASVLSDFEGVAPAYARSLLTAFERGARNGGRFDWDAVLSFSEWVLEQNGPVPATDSMTDTNWSAAHGEVANVLSVACSKDALPDAAAYERARALILRCLDSADPTPEEEAERSELHSPYYNSINTTRGKAGHALIAWIGNRQEAAAGDAPLGLSALPDARAALNQCLEPSRRRLVTHAVIGSHLSFLAWMDRAWVVDQLPRIFPEDSAAQCTATWTAFICWGRPIGVVSEILRHRYEDAIVALPDVPELAADEDYTRRLVDHLATLLWWDALEDKDGVGVDLCDLFFENASGAQRQEMLGTLGRSLGNEASEVSDSLVRRFKQLWEYRMTVARDVGDTSELEAFGWWFHSGRIQTQWSLQRLQEVWRFHGKTSADTLVLEDLVRLAGDEPTLVARCLDALTISGTGELWGYRDHVFNALSSCYASGEPDAVNLVTDAANRLVAGGRLEFRSVLKP